MSIFMVNQLQHVENSLGKMYASIIMAFSMVLLEVGMHDHQYGTMSWTYIIPTVLTIALFVYLYRTQKGVTDRQYLQGMIEHHSMALLPSQEILEKSNNYDVTKLAKNIIQTQKDEIAEMQRLLNNHK